MGSGRRAFLAGVGLAAATGTAGCLDFLAGDGDGGGGTATTAGRTPPTATGTGDGGVEPPRRTNTGDRAPAAAPFVRWVPPADAVGGIEGPRAGAVDYLSPAAVRAHLGAFSPDTVGAFDSLLRRSQTVLDVGPLHLAERYGRRFGVGADAVDAVLRFGDAQVVLGTFDRATVAGALAADGYARAGEYRGFRVFGARTRTVAVRPGVAVVAAGEGRAGRGVLRTVLDAGTGAGRRRVRTDPGYGRLVGEYAAPGVAVFRSIDPGVEPAPSLGRFRGLVARGFGWRFGPERTALTVAFVFRSAATARPDAVRAWARSLPGLEGYDYAVDTVGRVVRVAGTVPTGEYDGLAVGTPAPPTGTTTADDGAGTGTGTATGGDDGDGEGPAVDWRFAVDYGAGALSVTHAGGPALALSRVTVTVGGEARDARRVGDDGDDELERDEGLAVPVAVEDGGAPVRVRYATDDGRVTVGRYRLPAA